MCAPCKPIIDCGGVLAAALRRLARAVGLETPLAIEAFHYAETVEGAVRTMIFAHENPKITAFEFEGSRERAIDRAHAWSELSCRRAKLIRAHASGLLYETMTSDDDLAVAIPDANKPPEITPELLMKWSEEHRMFITELVGGEYDSDAPGHEWIIDGVNGITKKE